MFPSGGGPAPTRPTRCGRSAGARTAPPALESVPGDIESAATVSAGSNHGDFLVIRPTPTPDSCYSLWVRLFFVEGFSPYSWALLPADASPRWPFRGGTSSRPARTGVSPAASRAASRRRTPSVFSPSGLPSEHSRGVLVRCRAKGGRTCDGCDDRIPGTYIRRVANRRPLHRSSRSGPRAQRPMLSSRWKSLPLVQRSPADEREQLERELHRRGQELVVRQANWCQRSR